MTKSDEPLIKLRVATDADTDFARTIHHAAYHDVIVRQFGSFDEKKQDDFFLQSWKPETHEIILSNEREAGYLSIERTPDTIVIHELVLLPEFQGEGIGSGLLRVIMQEATTRHVPIRLEVLKENLAQNLYRKLGFKDSGMTETHVQMEFLPDEK